MPIINRHQKALMSVDAMFTGLRLSSLLTQIPERMKCHSTGNIATCSSMTFFFVVVRQITNISFYFILSISAYIKMKFCLWICKVEKERVTF